MILFWYKTKNSILSGISKFLDMVSISNFNV
jgi:hypothetical protein